MQRENVAEARCASDHNSDRYTQSEVKASLMGLVEKLMGPYGPYAPRTRSEGPLFQFCAQ